MSYPARDPRSGIDGQAKRCGRPTRGPVIAAALNGGRSVKAKDEGGRIKGTLEAEQKDENHHALRAWLRADRDRIVGAAAALCAVVLAVLTILEA